MSHAISVCHGEFGRAAIYELDKPIITHAHREGHLIFYLGNVRASVSVGDVSHPIDETHAVAVSPWEAHSFEFDYEHGSCLSLVLYVKPMWFLENSPSAKYALRFGSPRLTVSPRIDKLLNRLTSNLLQEDGSYHFDGLLFEMTRQCFEQSWHNLQRSSAQSIAAGRFSDFRVRRSLRLMQESYTADVEIDRVARDVGLSRPHFFKLFKKQMGVTPNIYLNTLRAEQAIEDLLTTDKTVTDIAYDLGFSSQASFTRFFGSNVGIAPSEYRRVASFS